MTARKLTFVIVILSSVFALAAAMAWGCREPIRFPSIKVPMPTSRPVDFPKPKEMRVAR